MASKKILKTSKKTRWGKMLSMTETGGEPIKISEKGTIVVDADVADQLVEHGLGWEYANDKDIPVLTEKDEEEVEDTEVEDTEVEDTEEETEEEEEEEEEEGIDIDTVKKMNGKEIDAMVEAMDLDEDLEWDDIKGKKVAERKAWLISKIED